MCIWLADCVAVVIVIVSECGRGRSDGWCYDATGGRDERWLGWFGRWCR